MGKSHDLATLKDDGGTFSGSLNVTGSNFASTTYTGTSVNPTGVYTGLTSDGGFTNNVRDSGYLQLSTNNVERMRIDASGRVTMPYQPMFQVENTSGWSHPSGTVLAPYSTAINNVGGHYNTSTYRFTAPIGGTYIFNAWWGTGNSWGAHSYLGMRFRINNLDHRTGWEHNSTIGYARDDAVIIVKLNANDFVEAYLESAISGSLSGGAGINGFQGCLLG